MFFLVANISFLVILILILITLLVKNYFWSRLLGETCADLGIALIAGATVAYFLLQELTLFLAFSIAGLCLIIMGILLMFFAESTLINTDSS